MLDEMGGQSAWANARSLFMHYRQYLAGDNAGYREERAWRDLIEPNERLEFVWPDAQGRASRTRARGFSAGRMWRRGEDAAVTSSSDAETRTHLSFWARDFYTMFSRLARRDPELTLRMGAANRIEVLDEGGAELGWWDIDSAGHLMRWGARFDEEETLSYVYGPFRNYGAIAFPSWGSSSAGDFRFEYAEVLLSARPLPRAVFEDLNRPPAADVRLR